MYPAHRGVHSPKAATGNAGSDADEARESRPAATRLPHAQGSPNPWLLQFPVGWRIYYEEQEFQSQVPSRYHHFIWRTYQCMCPVAAMEADMGCCSCSATRHHSSTTGMECHFTAMFFPSTFLYLIEQYSINATKFITHSLCIGAAGAGLPSDTIQKLVRWRSSVYETYTCHLLTHPSDTRTMAAAQ